MANKTGGQATKKGKLSHFSNDLWSKWGANLPVARLWLGMLLKYPSFAQLGAQADSLRHISVTYERPQHSCQPVPDSSAVC